MGNSVSYTEQDPKNKSDTIINNKIYTKINHNITYVSTKRNRADFIIKKDICCEDVKNNWVFEQMDNNEISYILIKK